jgi:hypothetical protein
MVAELLEAMKSEKEKNVSKIVASLAPTRWSLDGFSPPSFC